MRQQQEEDEAKGNWQTRIRFDEQPEVKHAGNAGNIDELVQLVPPFSAQTLDHRAGGGHSEGRHQEKRQHPESYEWPGDNVAGHALEIEEAIKPEIGCEVKKSHLGEYTKAKHPGTSIISAITGEKVNF